MPSLALHSEPITESKKQYEETKVKELQTKVVEMSVKIPQNIDDVTAEELVPDLAVSPCRDVVVLTEPAIFRTKLADEGENSGQYFRTDLCLLHLEDELQIEIDGNISSVRKDAIPKGEESEVDSSSTVKVQGKGQMPKLSDTVERVEENDRTTILAEDR